MIFVDLVEVGFLWNVLPEFGKDVGECVQLWALTSIPGEENRNMILPAWLPFESVPRLSVF